MDQTFEDHVETCRMQIIITTNPYASDMPIILRPSTDPDAKLGLPVFDTICLALSQQNSVPGSDEEQVCCTLLTKFTDAYAEFFKEHGDADESFFERENRKGLYQFFYEIFKNCAQEYADETNIPQGSKGFEFVQKAIWRVGMRMNDSHNGIKLEENAYVISDKTDAIALIEQIIFSRGKGNSKD